MGIAAAIIAGVTAIAATAVSAAGAASSADAAEEEAQRQREAEEKMMEKNRKLKQRELNLSGMDRLAATRHDAEQLGRNRSFNRDMLKALRSYDSGTQSIPIPAQQPTPAPAPQTQQPQAQSAPQRSSPPPVQPLVPQIGMGTTTMGAPQRRTA